MSDEPFSVEQLRGCKSGLNKRDLQKFRAALLEKRAEIVGDVEQMSADARNDGGNISHMPVHAADVGSDYYEQEFTLGLVESEKKIVREIDAALHRMEDGIYGICLLSGWPVGKARLEIQPWAKYCIDVVRERERRGKW